MNVPCFRGPNLDQKSITPTTVLWFLLVFQWVATLSSRADFQAGAAVIDVTPSRLPVLVNGGMFSRSVGKVKTPVSARAMVLSDGKERLAMVVVDSCMMPRVLLDEVKGLVNKRLGIATNRILISATHAHSAPSSMGCLGTAADPAYVPFLRDRLVQVIAEADSRREPAKIGFGRGNAAEFTALRQWIRRPDRLEEDPFGNKTVRANMHAGRVWDDVTGEAGPEDPELTLISVQSRAGRPLALLGNFSMHYFSDDDISADYFGLFCEGMKRRLAPVSTSAQPEFVALMSHGCSGDIWRRDYTQPEKAWNTKQTIQEYADGLVAIAVQAYDRIEYRQDVDLAMAERRLTLQYRVPDRQRLEWAQRIVSGMSNRLATTTTEVYAQEQLLLNERPQTEIVVQGIRLGDIAIATTPCETYAVTGLKIKAASPLSQTMVIELANGGDGYIPPPEQHRFGGYNTWPARSAGLEVEAEPKIAEACIQLLEQTSGKRRRPWSLGPGPVTDAILGLKPHAYWRLNEFTGPHASDASGAGRDAVFEPDVTYYLAGPDSAKFCGKDEINRAPQFVGGRLRSRLNGLGDRYSVSLWIWNGMPAEARGVSGWFYSRGPDYGLSWHGEHLGIAGTNGLPGRLVFAFGQDPKTQVVGRTQIPRWEWHHVVLVRDRSLVRVYLDGRMDLETTTGAVDSTGQWFFGGRSDHESNWEGRLDEVVVFGRVLKERELERLK
jgi:hypothetical protein